MATERWNVHFSGHVQGVGFRFQTAMISQNFAVTGRVANLDNGQVELVVEADPQEIKRFVKEIKQKMSGFIRGVEIQKSEPQFDFKTFEIRR